MVANLFLRQLRFAIVHCLGLPLLFGYRYLRVTIRGNRGLDTSSTDEDNGLANPRL